MTATSSRPILEQGDRRMTNGLVMTSGAFDLLHIDHVRHLNECREHGSYLIVALNSDQSVFNGKKRWPAIGEHERRAMLLESKLADSVVIFGERTPTLLIAAWRPAVFVVGSDYTPDRVAGREIIAAYGGRIVCRTAPRTTSTEAIQKRIKSL